MLDMSARWWSGGALFTHWCAFLCLAAAERDRANQLAVASPEATPASEALSAADLHPTRDGADHTDNSFRAR